MKIKLIDFGYKKAPERKHYNDAGADVSANIVTPILVAPHSSFKVPLGFGVEIPDGMTGFIFPRSSLSSEGLSCELSPIDSGYRGEIHAIVTNHNDSTFMIHNGDRIGQLVILPIVLCDYVSEIDEESRGTGAFGSTGK